jgi:16S rRNA (cytosine1402-N4)-methyltransferase
MHTQAHDLPDPGHTPVMAEDVLRLLAPRPSEVILDATVGRGGHAAMIVEHLAPGGRLIGLDLDPGNLEFVKHRLQTAPVPVQLLHGSFSESPQLLNDVGIDAVDGLLADLGFASVHVDDPARGFSFSHEGPLDMRFDPTAAVTAADLVATADQQELADIIWRYGEERFSRRIARKIVESRRNTPILTTRQLSELCIAVYGSRARRQRIHPATRTFQALRIAVNDELGRLNGLLERIPRLVRPGARIVVISFHSLEDRAVKLAFRRFATEARADLLTNKPIRADAGQRAANPRSRSARLRAIRWIN